MIRCSFCDKSKHDAEWLIAGHWGFICDECVDLCSELLGELRGDAEYSRQYWPEVNIEEGSE